MTTAGYTSPKVVTNPAHAQGFPFVYMGPETVVPRHNKTNQGAESTLALVCWHTTRTAAEQLGNVVLQSLTDRDAPISIDNGTLVYYDLDFAGEVLVDEEADNNSGHAYGVPYRIRYWTTEGE